MERISPCPTPLAWCHKTDAFKLQQIIRSGTLRSPAPCNKFSEHLTYYCLGKPAYKDPRNTSIGTMARAPVVILMSPDIYDWRKRVFPFDSGAFFAGRYRKYMHERDELYNYDVTRLPDSPGRFISSFYKSIYDYLTHQPRPPIVPYADFYQVEALVSMLTDPDASSADDRRLVMELQIEKPIPFEWPLVRGLILPRALESNSIVSSFLSGPGRGVEVRWFDVSPLKLAIEYQALLEREALEMQVGGGCYERR
ncbi:MAG TPA: hypothetical protein VGD45_28140 [Steroidobacter sp.]|uniref:hypothetical protein n=1 Tax=Steroidobacter sp. TaxID=1978227 RepID=UPI002ED9D4FF